MVATLYIEKVEIRIEMVMFGAGCLGVNPCLKRGTNFVHNVFK